MRKERIKITGQLLEDNKATVLIVTESLYEANKVIKEYQEVFPEIFINADWGYFDIPMHPLERMNKELKAKAINRVLTALFAPSIKLANQFNRLHTLKK